MLGLRKNGSRYSVNPRIKELSILQRKLQTQINNSNTEKCKTLRHERNKLLNKMHRLLEDEKHNKVIRNLEEVEKRHDDAGKMYAAVRILQGKRKKIPLLIDTNKGITTHEEMQVEIITEFYEKQFNQLDTTGILEAEPCEMTIPFKSEEIEKAIKTLGNNKAAGIDGIKAEHLKNSSIEVPKIIAEIFKETAKTGNCPKEIKM